MNKRIPSPSLLDDRPLLETCPSSSCKGSTCHLYSSWPVCPGPLTAQSLKPWLLPGEISEASIQSHKDWQALPCLVPRTAAPSSLKHGKCLCRPPEISLEFGHHSYFPLSPNSASHSLRLQTPARQALPTQIHFICGTQSLSTKQYFQIPRASLCCKL